MEYTIQLAIRSDVVTGLIAPTCQMPNGETYVVGMKPPFNDPTKNQPQNFCGSFLVSFHLRQRITIRPVVPQPHFHINLGSRIRTDQDLCTRTQPQQSP